MNYGTTTVNIVEDDDGVVQLTLIQMLYQNLKLVIDELVIHQRLTLIGYHPFSRHFPPPSSSSSSFSSSFFSS